MTMIEKPYFVILNNQDGTTYSPMVNEDGSLAMFNSDIDAIVAGSKNTTGLAFGFEVFELGSGLYEKIVG